VAPAADTALPIIELDKVCMSYTKPSGIPLPILADIDLKVRAGEIVGLLGRSGSGKSTLLRIAAGLIKPSSGRVIYRGEPLRGPTQGISVVFQTFALYPWLTVIDNVELGLDALRVSTEEARKRATSAIEMIGLDGFQSALPRELSGGMKQRVGFARALVSEPTLLLMDEPFSALDVLTAETLRTDFLDLWVGRQLTIKAVLMVTHNIEEAVMMCDRILVLGASPAHIVTSVSVPLPHPRDRVDPAFRAIVGEIYAVLTARLVDAMDTSSANHGGLALCLPDVSSHRLDGFMDKIAAASSAGYVDLAMIAASLMEKVDDLLPIAGAAHILEFAELRNGSMRLTAAGRVFAQAGDDGRKRLFREHLVQFVPLIAHIREVLDERGDHQAPRERFELELQDHLNQHDADRTLRTAIDWGRYAGLFSYDDHTRRFAGGC